MFNGYSPFLLVLLQNPEEGCSDYCILAKEFSLGREGEERKVAWVKWGDVCLLKDKGGLGIKDIETFNKELLDKWS